MTLKHAVFGPHDKFGIATKVRITLLIYIAVVPYSTFLASSFGGIGILNVNHTLNFPSCPPFACGIHCILPVPFWCNRIRELSLPKCHAELFILFP